MRGVVTSPVVQEEFGDQTSLALGNLYFYIPIQNEEAQKMSFQVRGNMSMDRHEFISSKVKKNPFQIGPEKSRSFKFYKNILQTMPWLWFKSHWCSQPRFFLCPLVLRIVETPLQPFRHQINSRSGPESKIN